MDEILGNTLKPEPIGSIKFMNEISSENRMTHYLLFSGAGKKYDYAALYWTSSKEDAIRGFMRSPQSDIIKILFMIEFDLKSYYGCMKNDNNSKVDSNYYDAIFEILKDKKFFFESEQFMSFCKGENPEIIDIKFSTEDYDVSLVSGVVPFLNVGNTYFKGLNGGESSYAYDPLSFAVKDKVTAFVSNN